MVTPIFRMTQFPTQQESVCVIQKRIHIPSYSNMEVSINGGTPESSNLIGYSIINHPFWGITMYGNSHICVLTYSKLFLHNLTWEPSTSRTAWLFIFRASCKWKNIMHEGQRWKGPYPNVPREVAKHDPGTSWECSSCHGRILNFSQMFHGEPRPQSEVKS